MRTSTWAGCCSRRATWRRRCGTIASALSQAPRHATAAFNLGTVLEDQGKAAEAIAAYTQALALDAGLADAHFNLSRLYEKAGQRQAAFRHLRTYRELVTGR